MSGDSLECNRWVVALDTGPTYPDCAVHIPTSALRVCRAKVMMMQRVERSIDDLRLRIRLMSLTAGLASPLTTGIVLKTQYTPLILSDTILLLLV